MTQALSSKIAPSAGSLELSNSTNEHLEKRSYTEETVSISFQAIDLNSQLAISPRANLEIYPDLILMREFILRIYRVLNWIKIKNFDLEEEIRKTKSFLKMHVKTDWLKGKITLRAELDKSTPEEDTIGFLWTMVRPVTMDELKYSMISNQLRLSIISRCNDNPGDLEHIKKIEKLFKKEIEDRLGTRSQRQNKEDPHSSTSNELLRAYLYGELSHHDLLVRDGVKAHYGDQFRAAVPFVLELTKFAIDLYELIDEFYPEEVALWINDYESYSFNPSFQEIESDFGAQFNMLEHLGSFPLNVTVENRFSSYPEEFDMGLIDGTNLMMIKHKKWPAYVTRKLTDSELQMVKEFFNNIKHEITMDKASAISLGVV